MDYWLRPFTIQSWRAFRDTDCSLIGFRSQHWTRARQIKSGDVILCYVQRAKRWVGALEVLSPAYRDSASEFEGAFWAVRCRVRPVVVLDLDRAVPMATLGGMLSVHREESLPSRLVLYFRRMLGRIDVRDGQLIVERLEEAREEPVSRPTATAASDQEIPVCASARTSNVSVLVTIPESDQTMINDTGDATLHAEIQWQLLQLGARLDQQLWIPRGDRRQSVNGMVLGEAPNMLEQLPSLSNVSVALYRTIEKFDCLWIRDNMIVAAFEVEHTPAVQGGLLRMRDLISLAPRTNIALYLVAPDEYFERFAQEIARPSFCLGDVPLHTVCGFLPHNGLRKKLANGENITRHQLNAILDEVAEFYDPTDDPAG